MNSNSCALLSDSTIKCWGYNVNGQLGDGSNTENLPWAFERDLLKLNNNTKIFVYDHTVGLMNYFRVIFKYLRRF